MSTTVHVGIDDTDLIDTPGTNQIARAIVAELRPRWRCRMILRHQLLHDLRVPFTSHNSSAALLFDPGEEPDDALFDAVRAALLERCPAGSDPGLCMTRDVPSEIVAYGHRCRTDVVPQDLARALAARHGIRLEGLGGTQDGVIGALAAVGLASTRDHGRVVHLDGMPDDLVGPTPAARVRSRGVDRFVDVATDEEVEPGTVDVGKHLRPNLRAGRVTLFVEPAPELGPAGHRAVRRD